MQIRMKTEEHEAFEGANRYRRTIHRGTSEALGDQTVVDPLSPKLVQERRREKAKQHEMATAEAKAKGYDPPPRIFLIGPFDYEAVYDGRRFWRRYNRDYLLFPVSKEPGTFCGWHSRGEDYLQAIGLGIPDPSEEGGGQAAGGAIEPPPRLAQGGENSIVSSVGPRWLTGAACVAEADGSAPYNRGEVTDRLWLDGRRGFALRPADIYRDGILERRIANGSVEEVSPGVWMPKSVEYRIAAFPTVPENVRGKPMVARRLKVLELRVNKIPEGALRPQAGRWGARLDRTDHPAGRWWCRAGHSAVVSVTREVADAGSATSQGDQSTRVRLNGWARAPGRRRRRACNRRWSRRPTTGARWPPSGPTGSGR